MQPSSTASNEAPTSSVVAASEAAEPEANERSEGLRTGSLLNLLILLTNVRDSLIDRRTMNVPQRVITYATLGLIATAALLLMASPLPQPVFVAGITGAGDRIQMPETVFAFTLVALVIGWTFALAGAMLVAWYLRLLVVALSFLALGFMPILSLSVILTHSGADVQPYPIEIAMRWAQIASICGFGVWAVGISLSRLGIVRLRGTTAVSATAPASGFQRAPSGSRSH